MRFNLLFFLTNLNIFSLLPLFFLPFFLVILQATTLFTTQACLFAHRISRRVNETLAMLYRAGHSRTDISSKWQKQIAQLPANSLDLFAASHITLKSLHPTVLEAIASRKRLLSVRLAFICILFSLWPFDLIVRWSNLFQNLARICLFVCLFVSALRNFICAGESSIPNTGRSKQLLARC
jgi:hypothetical protein